LARGPQYNLRFRRRREGRTNYRKRRRLVTSGTHRFVVRPSNKHISAQVIAAKPEGDLVLASAHSSELKQFGWRGSCSNIPAAYLTGLLAGRRAKAGGISKAVLDIGVHSKGPGSRIFAAAKGAFSAGLAIPHDESAMPSPERVKGRHVVEYSKHLSSEPEAYKKFFSKYLKQKLKPEELEAHFSEIEAKIMAPTTEAPK
jgi:large subunit ribosomal protein L18